MKLYIAGKMTGDPDYRAKFNAAAEKLEAAGHVVLNPAVQPDGLTQADYMRVAITMLCISDMAVFLPDWKESEGAKVERAYANKIGKPVKDWADFMQVEKICKTCGGLCAGSRCYVPMGANLGNDEGVPVMPEDFCSAWHPRRDAI